MNDVKLGQVPDWDAERDAVHIAIIPGRSSIPLEPGEQVGILKEYREASDPVIVSKDVSKKVGIVDPFLDGPSTHFWLCLFPKTVKSLRHSWEHPDIQDVTAEEDDSCRGC